MRSHSILIFMFISCMLIIAQSEAECTISEATFVCINEDQKTLLYQYHLKKIDAGDFNITAIEVRNTNFSDIENFLNSLEDEVKSKMRQIKLNQCDIEDIPDRAFAGFDALEVLDLDGNHLEDIHFLETLPESLRIMSLRNNMIQEVPDVFSQLKNLEIVDLSYCHIENLNFVVFKHNLNLSLVNVSHNNIASSVSDEYLKNIKCVDLSYNDLSEYNNIPSYCLDLTATKISSYNWHNISSRNKTVLIDRFFYSDNEHLRLEALNKDNNTLPIEIRYLNISKFRGNITSDLDLKQVKVSKEFIMKQSDVSSLDRASYDFQPHFFREGSNAFFDLSSCSITDISPYYFENYSLGRLNLCHNRFQLLRESVFENAYIIQLDLCFSKIEKIDEQAFDGLHTHTLNLASNSIDDLSFLRNIRDVYVVDLSHNILTTIASDSFANLNNMKTLDLSFNMIDTVEGRSFHHGKVEIIHLNNNKLHSLRTGTFEGITNLKGVYLQYNPITVIEANAFKSLPNLRSLRLEKMEISVIQPYAFNDLQNLQILQLNDNKLNSLPALIFWKLPSLKQLDVSGNSLEKVEGLRGLDLQTLSVIIDNRVQYETIFRPTIKYVYVINPNTPN